MPSSAPNRPEFRARYLVESSVPSDRVAQVIAGEQSSGTFLALPGETEQLKERSRARVVRVQSLPPVFEPTLESAFVARQGHAGVFHRAEIEIAFPTENVGNNLPTLLATVAGNLFELGEVTALRLLDLDLPESYAATFPGPAFGIRGTRRLAGVHGRPLIGTIIKPSIGLSAGQTAGAPDAEGRAGEGGCIALGQVQVEQAQGRDLAEFEQVARHGSQQRRQVVADVFGRECDLDFGAVEHACVALTRDEGTFQRGLEHRRQRLDAHDPGARPLFQLLRFAGQRQEGTAGLLACDHLRHLVGRNRTLDQVTGAKLGAVRSG